VQSDLFTKHNNQLSFFGQESKDFTYRLCRMNLFIHGLDGNIQLGNSYFDDKHSTVKADYLLANPPFNDGSKGENGWGADKIPNKDPRLVLAKARMALAPRNANTMWILHFLSHLKDGGTAGFVMATGELASSETTRLEVRRTLVEQDYVDCIVGLTASCSRTPRSHARSGSFRRTERAAPASASVPARFFSSTAGSSARLFLGLGGRSNFRYRRSIASRRPIKSSEEDQTRRRSPAFARSLR